VFEVSLSLVTVPVAVTTAAGSVKGGRHTD